MQPSSHWASGSKVQRSEVGRSPHWSNCEKLGPLSSTVFALYYPKKIPSKLGLWKEAPRRNLSLLWTHSLSLIQTLYKPHIPLPSSPAGCTIHHHWKLLPIPTYTPWPIFCLPSIFSSVQFSHSVMSDSLWPHESQHTRPPCPLPTPGVHSDSCPSSQ